MSKTKWRINRKEIIGLLVWVKQQNLFSYVGFGRWSQFITSDQLNWSHQRIIHLCIKLLMENNVAVALISGSNTVISHT